MAKIYVQTYTNPLIISRVLKDYGVFAFIDEWDYTEMIFDEETFNKRVFFSVMKRLLEEKINVTVLDVSVPKIEYSESDRAYIWKEKLTKNSENWDWEMYNNFKHVGYGELSPIQSCIFK